MITNEAHRTACEEQPDEFPCICNHLAAEEYDEMVELQIMQALEK